MRTGLALRDLYVSYANTDISRCIAAAQRMNHRDRVVADACLPVFIEWKFSVIAGHHTWTRQVACSLGDPASCCCGAHQQVAASFAE